MIIIGVCQYIIVNYHLNMGFLNNISSIGIISNLR